ncbi:hypothetical protein PIB30_029159 [Stylosanthes scabra]|uniref:Uncharacterized protein n=1 Tax=Stylosanthes scabra TaxID=79078 RepID=A0ABU6YBQ8_9FABA|nr:hypothetical protein [Stylosanthes scabra]
MELPPLPDEDMWPLAERLIIMPNSYLRRNLEGRPMSMRLRNEMDEVEPDRRKRCGLCRVVGGRLVCLGRPCGSSGVASSAKESIEATGSTEGDMTRPKSTGVCGEGLVRIYWSMPLTRPLGWGCFRRCSLKAPYPLQAVSKRFKKRCCLEFMIQPPVPKSNPLSPDPHCHRVKPAVTRFPSTCAMLPWRTTYGQGTATMLAGVSYE